MEKSGAFFDNIIHVMNDCKMQLYTGNYSKEDIIDAE